MFTTHSLTHCRNELSTSLLLFKRRHDSSLSVTTFTFASIVIVFTEQYLLDTVVSLTNRWKTIIISDFYRRLTLNVVKIGFFFLSVFIFCRLHLFVRLRFTMEKNGNTDLKWVDLLSLYSKMFPLINDFFFFFKRHPSLFSDVKTVTMILLRRIAVLKLRTLMDWTDQLWILRMLLAHC